MRLRLLALFIVLMHAPRDVAAQVITFTNVVDSTTMPIVRGTSCLYPAINNAGDVAFLAGIGTARGVYRWEGGAPVPIIRNEVGTNRSFDPIGGVCYGPDINDSGRVVALAFLPNDHQELLAGDGGPVVTVADTNGEFLSFSAGAYEVTPSIRNDGVIFFGVTFDALRLRFRCLPAPLCAAPYRVESESPCPCGSFRRFAELTVASSGPAGRAILSFKLAKSVDACTIDATAMTPG